MNAAQIKRGITKIAHNPWKLFSYLSETGIFNWLDDETYLKLKYRGAFDGKKLNLENPQTYNEKLQWLKLHDRKPEYTRMVDKYEVKQYIAEKIGAEYVIPTLGVWECFEDINFDALPDQFVLKCTHDSGGLVICRDKSKLDVNAAKRKITKSLKKNYYLHGREWPYKDVKPRIIAEQYKEDDCKSERNLDVYKIFNFNGKPQIIQFIQNDKTENETIDYFDVEWNLLDLRQKFPNSNNPISRPHQLEQMITLAAALSDGFRFLRTDFYIVNQKVFFSEFTFFSDSGFAVFDPVEWDKQLGEWINIDMDR